MKTVAKNRIKEISENNGDAIVRAVISPPNIAIGHFTIRGTAPYVQNRFAQKAVEMMKKTQSEGSVAKKGRKREPKRA